MKYWYVIHDLKSYHQHKDLIGNEKEGRINKIKKGDKIVYHAKGISAVIGTFEVISSISKRNIQDWGETYVYKIKPISLSKIPLYSPPFKEVKKLLPSIPSVIKGLTIKEIKKEEFDTCNSKIKEYKPPFDPQDLFKGPSNDEDLGHPKELGLMRYTPTNEMGVVALFVHYMKDLGFEHFEFIRSGFPDACVHKKTEKGVRKQFIEFEFKSSGFLEHIKKEKNRNIKCDYLICWEDDTFYGSCPIKLIELKSEINKIIKDKN